MRIDTEILHFAQVDSVATLTLNRPSRKNALSIELRNALSDALDNLATQPSVSCVVLTGAGDVFSSGFDLGEFERAATDDAFSDLLWRSSDRYHRTVLEFPLPTIAAVNGPAIAGGFDLAVCCDLRVASETARFSHPEYTFGDVVYGPLHDIVGGGIARELCMTGRVVTAAEAAELRLVNSVFPAGDLEAAAQALAQRVAAAPRSLLARTKAKAIARARVVGKTLDL